MIKLLIVDDEAIEREALKFIIENSPLSLGEIREAVNGQEAITVAAQFDPDVVFMDIKMPGINGIEAAQVIKKIKPEIKIVFMTAFDRFEYAQEAIKIGVEDFIVKPAPKDRTIEVLDECINKLEYEKRMRRQKESLEVKLDQISHYLENEFVGSVVNGEIDEQQAEDYLKFMVSEFVEGFGVVIEVDFMTETGVNHLHRNMIKRRFAEQLSALLDNDMKIMMNQVKNTIYLLVYGYQAERRPRLIRMIEDEIQMTNDDIIEQMDAKVYYGFGEGYGKISLLWKSFAQAKAASRNMFLERVESCENVGELKTTLEFVENELCIAIINERRDDVIRLADHVLDNMIFASNDINASRLRLYEFFILLNRYLNKESQLKHPIPDRLFEDLKTIDSRGEAKNYVHQYLFGILEEQEAQKTNKTSTLLEKAVHIIENNYDEGITLEDIANEVGFSTYYFGKIFKKTYKVSFTDYLANVRLAEAKKLLKETNLSIKDITYRTGYMDPNYFTRVFKKCEGMTPTEYRTK